VKNFYSSLLNKKKAGADKKENPRPSVTGGKKFTPSNKDSDQKD